MIHISRNNFFILLFNLKIYILFTYIKVKIFLDSYTCEIKKYVFIIKLSVYNKQHYIFISFIYTRRNFKNLKKCIEYACISYV